MDIIKQIFKFTILFFHLDNLIDHMLILYLYKI